MRLVSRKSCTVLPAAQAGHNRVLSFSGADHFVRPRHIPVLLFYAAREDGQEVLPVERIKDALSRLLVPFYPTAGRIRRRQDRKLELLCNDAGIEFVEAEVSGRLSDFGDFQPNPLYTQLLDPGPAVLGDAVFDCPLTYVQVTRFACGGAALVVTINHACTDGLSFNMFVNSLSEMVRGRELSLLPVHDRTLLKARGTLDPAFSPSELRVVSDLTAILPKLDPSLWPAERMFVFSPAQLKRIKALAMAGAEQTYTTFESINAHVWRCITKARRLQPERKTKFLTTLDARARFKPELPKGYFGNCICFVRAVADAGDVASKPLSFSAQCIRDAIAGFTSEYMNSLLAFVEAQTTPLVMNANAGESRGHDVSAASWIRMGFMDADMGSGKPIFASPGNNPFDGSVIMLPSHKGDGYINVFVGLEREHMENLSADPEFLPSE